jgi:hypothetical protein
MNKKNFFERLLLFSIISIPLLTILFGTDQSPFKYTLSMMGNWFGSAERFEFIIWGLFIATTLTLFLFKIYKETRFKNKKAYESLYLSTIFLMLTVIVPTAHREPIPMEMRKFLTFNIHNAFAIIFAIFLMLSIYYFMKYLSKKDKEISVKSIRYLLFTAGGSILLLTIFGMTGIFEIFFFLALSIFLIILDRQSKKLERKLLRK